MFVDAVLTYKELDHVDMNTYGAVAVIDVLRATTTILTALEKGAAGVIPVATPEEAFSLREQRGDVVLAGERAAVRIEGFDFGNSPLEFTSDTVAGKVVVLSTTNGTQSFQRVRPPDAAGVQGSAVFAGCLRNAGAVAHALVGHAQASGNGVLLVCSGTDGRFSREDAYCASIVLAHMESITPVVRGDGAEAVARIGRVQADSGRAVDVMASDVSREELLGSFHGRRLLKLGLRTDVEFCAQTDVSSGVPRLVSGMLVLAGT